MTCRHCGREAPEGRHCTWCGMPQDAAAAPGPGRRFAAAPNEAVVAPSIMTSMFPHLDRRGIREYRWAFGGGLLVLVGLYLLGFIAAAFAVAAVLVPVIYVMYLYEARVYRDAPIPVLLATIGGGLAVGAVATLVLDPIVAARPTFVDGAEGPVLNLTGLLLAAVLLPLIQEVLKPIPALVLRGRPAFRHSVDGLVFGVAAGLGFAAAQTILHYQAVLTRLPVRSEPGLWILPLLSVAILVPLLHGSTTGILAGSLWRVGRRPLPRLAGAAIVAALTAHVAFALGTQLLVAAGVHSVFVLAWQAVVVVAVVLALRLLLDAALHEEAIEEGLSQTVCANCGSAVLAAGFCPECGVAISATAHPINRTAEAATGGAATGGAR